MKLLLTTFIIFFAFFCTAQQKKKNVYFMKNDGRYVNQRDSADYMCVVTEPDSGSDLYNVMEFYLDGTKKLVGHCTKFEPPVYEGQCVTYYKSGVKESLVTYKKGKIIGTGYVFYPNGKPYLIRQYPDDDKPDYNSTDNFTIKAEYDSLGTPLFENGNGYYKSYDSNFKYVDEEGAVKDGRRDGQWKGNFKNVNTTFTENYSDGALVSGTATFDDGKTATYTQSRQKVPEFKGGVVGFGKYLSNHIKYPVSERENRIQGVVIVSFVIEKDGKTSDVKVKKTVDESLDEEAVRVIKNSPLWVPGMQFGRPVRVSYSVPISFSLTR